MQKETKFCNILQKNLLFGFAKGHYAVSVTDGKIYVDLRFAKHVSSSEIIGQNVRNL